MKKTIGIILIVLALGLGYLGFTQLQESRAAVEILGLEITAEDKESSGQAYVLLGLGAVCLVGGIVLLAAKKE
jgi:hypothetical protein